MTYKNHSKDQLLLLNLLKQTLKTTLQKKYIYDSVLFFLTCAHICMGHVPARRRSLYFHGQNDNTMQTSSGFKYWLTKSSIMSSTYSVIKTSQLANVAGSAWKSNPQMGFKVSATAFSLLGSMMTLSIAWIRIWQAVQDKSFLAD